MRWQSTDSTDQASPSRHTGTCDFGFAASRDAGGPPAARGSVTSSVSAVPDVIARDTSGALRLYPRTATAFSTRQQMGTSW